MGGIRTYLKGSVFCAHCGSRLCLTNAKGRYLYFFCVGRHQRRTVCPQRYLAAEDVEQAVIDYYRSIRMPVAVQDAIRTGLRHELDQQRRRAAPEIHWAKQRVIELAAERRRLASGVVTGAIPEDLGREEQDRIRAELKHAQNVLATAEVIFAHIEDNLNRALSLVGRCDEIYRRGGPRVRRLSNQFFFTKLLVEKMPDERPVVTATVLNEQWATLLAEDFQQRMAHSAANPDHDLSGQSSK